MGRKDSPPPCVMYNKQQLQRSKSYEYPDSTQQTRFPSSVMSASVTASVTSSVGSSLSPSPEPAQCASVRRQTLERGSSPIHYVPRCKASVNLHLKRELGLEKRKEKSATIGLDFCEASAVGSPVKTYMESIAPRSVKCVLVGDSGVGKTSLLMRYTVAKFSEQHSPTIYDKFSTSLSVYGKRISMTLCDTSGHDDFSHLRPLCYPQVDVALICFSVVDYASFENVKQMWVKEIRRHCPGAPIIVVGTQVDKRQERSTLPRELKSMGKRSISRSEGQKMAVQCKALSYIECSSRTQLNIKATFDEAIAAALEMNSSKGKHHQGGNVCSIL